MLPLLLALLAQAPALAPELMIPVIAVGPPHRTFWGTLALPIDDGQCEWSVVLEDDQGGRAAVVWHYDRKTPVGLDAIGAGTPLRVRQHPPNVSRQRVEVHGLGPLAFDAAQEEWVIDTACGKFSAGLSASELAVAEALGSRSWLVRESVSRSLRERGPRAMRLLLWIRRHPDPEVRARAEAVLSRLGWTP